MNVTITYDNVNDDNDGYDSLDFPDAAFSSTPVSTSSRGKN